MLQIEKKNILFAIGQLTNGGAERVISVLANQFFELGYNVTVLTIAGDYPGYPLSTGINYLPIVCKSKYRVIRLLERLFMIRKYIAKTNADVVVSFLADVNIHVLIANLLQRTKIIISERNDPSKNPDKKYIRAIRNILYILADGTVFQTEDAQNYFKNVIKKRSIIIPNPVKSELPVPYQGIRKKTIVTACRLTPQKNLKLLIDSFSKLNAEYPDYTLHIYGDGELKNELQNYIDCLGLKNKIQLMGFNNKLHEEIVSAQMFVISSDYEGMSNSLLEAMAIGLPVISTDSPIGGAKMLIENNINGILVPLKDVDSLHKSMKKIIESSEFSQKISYNASKVRETHHQEKITKDWEKFIFKTLYD